MKNALGLTEEDYRGVLSYYNVASCKELTQKKAARLIDDWEQKALQAGVWQSRKGRKNFVGPRPRTGATPAQLRKVEAMWAKVSRTVTDAGRKASLNAFVKRLVKREKLEWCTHRDCEKLIKALENMGA